MKYLFSLLLLSYTVFAADVDSFKKGLIVVIDQHHFTPQFDAAYKNGGPDILLFSLLEATQIESNEVVKPLRGLMQGLEQNENPIAAWDEARRKWVEDHGNFAL